MRCIVAAMIAAIVFLPHTASAQSSKPLSGTSLSSKPPSAVCQRLPTVGTTFVNTYYVLDSSGVNITDTVPDGKLPNDEQTVLQSGISIKDRSNVVSFIGPAHADTTYLSYASNGDVYLWNSSRGKANWERLPFGLKPGKVLKTKPMLDTGSILGEHYALDNSTETEVLGWDTASVAGKPVPCIHLRILTIAETDKSMQNKLADTKFINATNYWYSPEIGYFARINFGWGGKYFMNQAVGRYEPHG